jgi:WD40 repeat protein
MSNTSGPPVPAFILRGHASTVHALHFFASNAYLASADSDGWVVIWSLSSKRAVAVWKAHAAGILGMKDWESERLIT